MDFVWNVLSNVVAGLLILGGGAMIGWLKFRGREIASPLLYGVVGAAALALAWTNFVGSPVFSKYHQKTNEDNIESQMKSWTDEFGIGLTKQVPIPDGVYFAYVLLPTSGHPMTIIRSKTNKYLQFQAQVAMAPDITARLTKLKPQQAQKFMNELLLTMNANRIGFQTIGAPIQMILIIKPTPLNSSLTEESFLDTVNLIDSQVGVVQNEVPIAIEDAEREGPLQNDNEKPKLH